MQKKLIFICLLFVLSPIVSPAQAVAHETKDIPAFSFEEELRVSYALTVKWFRHSMREKGLFRYTFKPGVKNIYGRKNNAIRQLMASRLLAEMCKEDSSWLPMHQKNLDFLFKYWYKEKGADDTIYPEEEIGEEYSPFIASNVAQQPKSFAVEQEAYMYYNKKSKLGANAMMLRTLVASPLFEQYKLQAARLYNGIKASIYPDGSMEPFYREPTYNYDKDYLLTFYSGEALVALVEYAQKIQSQEAMNLAMLSQDFYIKKYVEELEKNYYPAYVPWHTISLNLLYKASGDAKYAEAIFVLNDKLLEMQDTTTHIGRFFNPETPHYGSPHTSSDGVYTEGMAYAYEVAMMEGDKQRATRYLRSISLSIPNLRAVQYTAEMCKDFEQPERTIGGFKSTTTGSWIRIDCVQHIMDAYRKLLLLIP